MERDARQGVAREDAGFTLVESLIAAVVVAVGMLATFTLVTRAHVAGAETRSHEQATGLAREVVEAARSVPFPELLDATIEDRLASHAGLADDSPSDATWTIRRRGTTYTVRAQVCALDDPSDGTGPHGGGFCPDSAGEGDGDGPTTVLDFANDLGAGGTGASVDGSLALGGGSPEDLKRVEVEVTWPQGRRERRVRTSSLVTNPGNAAGPAITLFAATSLSSPLVTAPGTNAVALQIRTSVTPTGVKLAVDGEAIGQATGAGVNWTGTWPITTLADGVYTLTAQAYDRSGVSGTARSLTLTLNRSAPAAPDGLRAGRNGSVVELEWNPSTARDLAGYRVYRQTLTGSTRVCELTTRTWCQDTDPPGAGVLTYSVRAVDRAPDGSLREGAASVPALTALLNTRPNPPTGLVASTSNGAIVLRWDAPSPDDPDLGDGIAFFRVYRDGVAYADRFDRTGSGTETTWTDTRTDGETHSYWVTAVDERLAESTAIGPVTR